MENNDVATQRQETVTLFASYAEFEKRLKKLFGQEDEKKAAEDALFRLKQEKSCFKYTAEFIRLCAKTEFDDAAKQAIYYQGLKSDVKDDLAREDLPDTFKKL